MNKIYLNHTLRFLSYFSADGTKLLSFLRQKEIAKEFEALRMSFN